MANQLKRPLLVECVCEFRFDHEANGWDWTLPGQFYEQIKSEFPLKFETEFIAAMQLIKGQPSVEKKAIEKIGFKREDESALVQIAPSLLSVNHLLPYPGGEAFRHLVMKIFRIYKGVAAEFKISRIGLRYVNHIYPDSNSYRIEDYLSVMPDLKGGLNKPLNGFYQRYELQCSELDGVLTHQTADAQNENDEHLILLDLDFFSVNNLHELLLEEKLDLWIKKAHDYIYEAFESSLNEKYFNELK